MVRTEAVHPDPVWRDRADFVIAVAIDPGDTRIVTEQLWCRKLNERTFEVCCIPFFAYDIALADVVEVDDAYVVSGVSSPSGRYVFRVLFDPDCPDPQTTLGALQSHGALIEQSSARMCAVDAEDSTLAELIADLLAEEEQAGRLIYETGRS